MIYLYFYFVHHIVPMPKHISEGICILSFSQQAVHSTYWVGGCFGHKAVLT